MALTSLYGYVTMDCGWKKWVLFFSSMPLAVIGNLARISTVALVAQGFGQDLAMKVYHEYSGYIVFSLAILSMLALGADPVDSLRQMKNVATDPYSKGRNFAGHFFIVRHARVEHATASGFRSEDRGVLVQFRRGDLRPDDLVAPCAFHPGDLPAPRGDVPHHVPHGILRNFDLDIVDGLQQDRSRFEKPLPECLRSGNLERHFRGINVVV